MFRLIGVIHLPPLPGSPRSKLSLARIAESVKADALALRRARYDAVIVENFGDAPFLPGPVEPVTVAAMTVCVGAAAATGLPVGVNVLRNDVKSALAIAVATGSAFVRVTVHVGAVVADQGLIEGRAHETLRLRRLWGAESVRILADVDVKHAAPLAPRPVSDVVKDTLLRGLADGVIVTGAATGAKVDAKALRATADAAAGAPVLVGSGATPEDLARLCEAGATGVIVGSWLRRGGRAGGPVDATRARAFAAAFRRAFS